MLITNETDYALRILRALTDGEKHKVTELCAQEAVPQQFAYKIIRKLAGGGLIESTRGPYGGIRLTAELDKITLLDVVDLTDSERYIMDCMRPGYKCTWIEKSCGLCHVHARLTEIQKTLDNELKAYTLQELLSVPKAGKKAAGKAKSEKTKKAAAGTKREKEAPAKTKSKEAKKAAAKTKSEKTKKAAVKKRQ